jgi:hypothetical protein
MKQKHMSILANAKNKATSGNVKKAFKNEAGAIDLASIMVGIIVIGLIGGVIAATVFAVIPWAQDNAAKQQLDAVNTAQSARAGLNDGKYSINLTSLLDSSAANVSIRSNESNCYGAFVTSASGATFYTSSTKTQPVKIAANAVWPAQKPTDYPVGCAWPGSKEGAVVPSVQNFISNSSFETDLSGGTSIGDPSKSLTRVQSDTAHSGNYILQVGRTTQVSGLAYAFYTSELEPGKYVSSMKMRANIPVSLTGYNEGAVYNDGNVTTTSRPAVTLDGEWKTVYTEFTVNNKSVVKAGFLANKPANGGEIIDVDSVQVVKATGNITKDTAFGDY